MKGNLKIGYVFPNNSKVKSRVQNQNQEANFTKDLRAAIQEAAEEILNTNALTVRALIEKHLVQRGWQAKKEAYQKHLDENSKGMFLCKFGADLDAEDNGSNDEVEVKPVEQPESGESAEQPVSGESAEPETESAPEEFE